MARLACRNAGVLLDLWKAFGLQISPYKTTWMELAPFLRRLPPLKLIHPEIDRKAAEEALALYFRDHSQPLRPIRWFSDARSAHAHGPGLSFFALPAFPTVANGPRPVEQAWVAGNSNPCGCGDGVYRDWLRKEGHEGEAIESMALLLKLFAAGVFYYWIGSNEVVLVERPSLWLEEKELHRH